jgi:hypothetical protein
MADPSGRFSLRVTPRAGIECRVTRERANCLLSVEPRDLLTEQAEELFRSCVAPYLAAERERIGLGTAEAEAEAAPGTSSESPPS